MRVAIIKTETYSEIISTEEIQMDWGLVKMFRREEKKSSVVKVVLITVGVIAAIGAILAVLYTLFKKYFTITFECGDCENCDEDCFDDELAFDEPICCEADDILEEPIAEA